MKFNFVKQCLLGIVTIYEIENLKVDYSLITTNQMSFKLDVSPETAPNISSQRELLGCILY